MPKTIDMTPTWRGLMPALLTVIECGTEQGKRDESMYRVTDSFEEHFTPDAGPGDYIRMVDDEGVTYCAWVVLDFVNADCVGIRLDATSDDGYEYEDMATEYGLSLGAPPEGNHHLQAVANRLLPEARRNVREARAELYRLAEFADKVNAAAKEHNAPEGEA